MRKPWIVVALALAAWLGTAGADARAQAPPGPGDEEMIRLRAQLEALRREVDGLRGDLAAAKERLGRIEAERAAIAVPGVGTAGGKIPPGARIRYVLDAAIPRALPEDVAVPARLFEDPEAFARVVSLVAEPRHDVVRAAIGAREIAAVGYGGVLPGPARPLAGALEVVAFEFPAGVDARRGWPWAAVRRVEPFEWVLFGERFVLLMGGMGGGRLLPVPPGFVDALERAAAPIPLVHASDYPALMAQAAAGDLAGSLGPGGFAVSRAPAADGFFARALGEKLDLRPGDVVTSVNGVAVGPELTGAALAARLRDAQRFEVSLTRGERPLRITVEIRDGEARIRERQVLSRAEQLDRLARAEALLEDLGAAIRAGDAGRVASSWTAIDRTLRDRRRIDQPEVLARLREVGRRRDERLGEARDLLREGLLGEGRKVIESMEAARRQGEPHEALAAYEKLEALAARIEAVDASLAPAAAELRAQARPVFERARIDREISMLRVAVGGAITAGGVTKAVVNGRALGEGDAVVDAGGEPVAGLKVARIRAGRVTLEYKGVEFEPAAEK